MIVWLILPQKEPKMNDTWADRFGCLIMLLIALGFISWGGYEWRSYAIAKEEVVEIRTDNIVKVFTHNAGSYSVLVDKDKKLESVFFGYCDLMADVAAGEPCYAITTITTKKGWELNKRTTLHIHTPHQLEGGSWSQRRGKHTDSGQTNIVE